MQLVWCYIDGYSCLRRANFSLNSNYAVHYDEKRRKVLVEKRRVLPPGFFSVEPQHRTSIANISGVVGGNGTGKTSLSSFMFKLKQGEEVACDYILMFADEDGEIDVRYHFEDGGELDCRVAEGQTASRLFSKIGLTGRSVDCNPINEVDDLKLVPGWKETLFLYYSPVFTTERVISDGTASTSNHLAKDSGREDDHCRDWSTTGLLHSLDRNLRKSDFRDMPVNHMASFNLQEKRRIAVLLGSIAHIDDEKLEFVRVLEHTSLVIGIERTQYDSRRALATSPLAAFVQSYVERLSRVDGGEGSVLHKWLEYLESKVKLDDASIEEVDIDVEKMLDRVRPSNDFAYTVIKHFSFALCVIRGLRRFWMPEVFRNPSGSSSRVLFGALEVPLGDCPVDLDPIYKLLNYCAQDPYLESCFRFDFSPMLSSGEMSFLTMWGRLFDTFNRVEKYPDPIRQPPWLSTVPWVKPYDVLLFVDEGETSLHPNLQRELIWKTIWFLGLVAPHARVHVIFSSHSPVILSDLPIGNVTFLREIGSEEKPDASSVVQAMHTRKGRGNTFGAAIFDLYEQSFFMQEGNVGQFATEKIDAILAAVNSSRAVNDYVLNLLGDPFLRLYIERKQAGGIRN